jgi:hypothetical protein
MRSQEDPATEVRDAVRAAFLGPRNRIRREKPRLVALIHTIEGAVVAGICIVLLEAVLRSSPPVLTGILFYASLGLIAFLGLLIGRASLLRTIYED